MQGRAKDEPKFETTLVETVVIGAGLCGLLLAGRLVRGGQSVIITEKSKGVGGRVATRRTETARFDHGAQFYTRQSPLEEAHQLWMQKNLVSHWFEADSKSHFNARTGMTTLAKQLAENLDIRFEQKTMVLTKQGSGWNLVNESGVVVDAERVILTAPIPQALELLKANQLAYDPALDQIQYAKAVVALIELQHQMTSPIGHRGYLESGSSDRLIFSIADQQAKGISATPALTVTLNPAASATFYDEADERVIEVVHAELQAVGLDVKPKSIQIKKWRYAHPLTTYSGLYWGNAEQNLFLAGDGFGGRSLNGAARSAHALADLLLHSV